MIKDIIEHRYSVRAYTDEPLTDSELNYILDCARLAPSAVNFQPWHFYVVKSDEAKAKLCRCYDRECFKSAPMYILCCVEHDEAWVRKYDNKDHGNIDVAIAAEHICLAATDLGLGTCWVCNFDPALCHQLFDLKENEEPAVIIPIGHAVEGSEIKEKNRKALDEISSIL